MSFKKISSSIIYPVALFYQIFFFFQIICKERLAFKIKYMPRVKELNSDSCVVVFFNLTFFIQLFYV